MKFSCFTAQHGLLNSQVTVVNSAFRTALFGLLLVLFAACIVQLRYSIQPNSFEISKKLCNKCQNKYNNKCQITLQSQVTMKKQYYKHFTRFFLNIFATKQNCTYKMCGTYRIPHLYAIRFLDISTLLYYIICIFSFNIKSCLPLSHHRPPQLWRSAKPGGSRCISRPRTHCPDLHTTVFICWTIRCTDWIGLAKRCLVLWNFQSTR